MTTAVLQQRAKLPLHRHDVFVSTVGGARITEPAGDLATAISIASAWKDRAVPTDVAAVGELGLAGELRRVRDQDIRLAEAARLGFRAALVPGGPGERPGERRRVDGLDVVAATDLDTALRALDLAGAEAAPRPRARQGGARPHPIH
jgi:DNA repair protein RadA/Sms